MVKSIDTRKHPPRAGMRNTRAWFKQQGWSVFRFQKEAWDAWELGSSGLIHASTGSGKTLAAWLGPVQHDLESTRKQTGLKVLWITPLRALATDTTVQLQTAAAGIGSDWRVESRTGDTSASQRAKQRKKPPDALVTTPESLSVLMSYARNELFFERVTTVIVDEWHELIGSKRGVMLELCLARLKTINPNLRTWGLSATLGNIEEAKAVLLGPSTAGVVIAGKQPRPLSLQTITPDSSLSFPWSGHLGLKLLIPVIGRIESAESSLLFTNTRAQAEIWFEALIKHRSDWIGKIALHHGSVDRKLRNAVEDMLRKGDLLCVVCTSSLDLGVDFSPVDQVIQVGSPKGVARLLQRAGRSGHQPKGKSSLVCVPTHAFELLEFAAAREAWKQNQIEARPPLKKSLDVLTQHLVTIALGSGFKCDDMLQEIRSTYSFCSITALEWNWAIDFVTRGGQALQAYPQYNRVVKVDGRYRVPDGRIARMHRMSIGTIGGNTTMQVKWLRGGRIGVIEEAFISRLEKGDAFLFSGRVVELVLVQHMTVYVRKTSQRARSVPRWQGGRMPLSSTLGEAMLGALDRWSRGEFDCPELTAISDLLTLQSTWSSLPGRHNFLIECIKLREGHGIYCYPFAGRLVHEGLATLVAWRISQLEAITFTLSVNDYGFELLSKKYFALDNELIRSLFTTENLIEDMLSCLNASEIAKRQFRDIARIAGLVFQGYPGSGKSTRQIQASSSLIYDVLKTYDSDNLLLAQAQREVMDAQLEIKRLSDTLESLQHRIICITQPERLTPMAFPLWTERLQSQIVSSETWLQRVERMLGTLEKAATETKENEP